MIPKTDSLVTRGRVFLVGIIATLIVLQLSWVIVHGYLGIPNIRATINIIVNYGLWLMVWQGRRWAIFLKKLMCGMSAVVTLIFGFAEGDWFFVVWAVVCVVIVISLIFSKSLNEFFAYQEKKRKKSSQVGREKVSGTVS